MLIAEGKSEEHAKTITGEDELLSDEEKTAIGNIEGEKVFIYASAVFSPCLEQYSHQRKHFNNFCLTY
jgi:hypothetical protein